MTSAHRPIDTTAPHDELGNVPVIHTVGTTTVYGGSRMYPKALPATPHASEHFAGIADHNHIVRGHITPSAAPPAEWSCPPSPLHPYTPQLLSAAGGTK